MTIPRFLALRRHWERYPPLPRLVAWYFGLGQEPAKPRQDFEAFYREMGGGALP